MRNLIKKKFATVDYVLIMIVIAVNIIITVTSIFSTFYSFHLQNSELPYEFLPYFLMDCVIGIFFMIFIAYHTQRLLSKGSPWWRILLIHFFMAFVVSLAVRAGIELTHVMRTENAIKIFTPSYLMDRYFIQLSNNVLRYFVILFIIYSYTHLKQIQIVKNRHTQLENQLLGTKLNLLKTQIQPHFLFNSLHAIVSLIPTDPQKATSLVLDLGDFLKETLNLKDSNLIPVSLELKILKKYLNILKLRFEDKLIVEQSIQFDVLNKQIPALIIQPIIENSIKHGFRGDSNQLVIKICMTIKDDKLAILIDNNGEKIIDTEEIFNRGIGLSNIKNRLTSLYDNEFDFKMENLPNGTGVRTSILIPI